MGNRKKIIPLIELEKFCNTFKVSMNYVTKIFKYNNFYKNIRIDKYVIKHNLKINRKKNKLTQEKLAKAFNTTHSAISAYENRIILIPIIFLLEFCKLNNLSIEEICNIKEIKEPVNS